MSSTLDRIRDLVDPVAAELEIFVYDLEYSGATIRILLDRDDGIDMGTITRATRKISSALDEADFISSAYTLEVSSPGIERTLRTEEHFVGAIGERVKIKTRRNTELDRRIEGELESVDGDTIGVLTDDGTVIEIQVSDIERARTEFVDTAAPKPGKAPGPAKSAKSGKPANSGKSAKSDRPATGAKAQPEDSSNDQE